MKTRNIMLASLMASVALPVAAPQYHAAFAQSLALEEIVVTARKRDESIFEIPVSVSSVSQTTLDRAGIDNAEELSDLVAGLDFQGSTSTGGRENPTIRFRGINQQIITPATQVGAIFWDGSYIGSGSGFLPLGDVERVEVIKGPQTAYFGRNTFSGAVNIIPKLPGDEWEGDVTLDYSPSQSDEYTIEAGVGGPINDKVGVRVWASYERDGGDYNTVREQDPYAVTKDTSVSGTMTFQPSDDLSLKVTGYYTKADDNGLYAGIDANVFGVPAGQCNLVYEGLYYNNATMETTPFTRDFSQLGFATWCGEFPDGENIQTPFTVRPGPGDNTQGDQALVALESLNPFIAKYGFVRDPDGKLGSNNQTGRIQFSGDYDIGDHTLSFQASRAKTGTNNVRDFSYGLPQGQVGITGSSTYMREAYYEARIASPQDQRLRYLIGVSDYTQRYRQANSPTSPAQATLATSTATLDFQDNTTTAIFGSIDYDITEELTLSVEGRYTDETSTQIFQGNPSLGCGVFTPVCDEENSYNDFIPRVILSYDVFEGASTYASYSESSLLGIPTQAGFVNSVAPDVLPASALADIGFFTGIQENTQYEWGWKQQADWWNFTLAVFYAEWINQPFAAVIVLPVGTTSLASNGNSDYKGFDFEFNAAPTDWLNLNGTLAYTKAKSIRYASRGSNESFLLGSGPLSVLNDGNDSRNTPEWTASLSPTITGEFGDREWFFRTDFIYTDGFWADYSEYNRAGSAFKINARLGVDVTETATIELWARNLTKDKTLTTNGGTTFGPALSRKVFTEVPQKREVGIRLNASF
ncbi:MAG: TonB-dependent receptor [Rhodospirillaceae bacterium]